jgi:hypothetical protein
MKTKLSLLAVLATVLSTSCKNTTPEPAASYALTHDFRTVLGVTPAEAERNEQPARQLSGAARLTAAGLELTIAAAGEEELALRIDRNRLTADYLGQYFLREASDRSGAADVTYTYSFEEGGARETRVYHNQPGTNSAPGGLVQITKYDAGKALISGAYHVQFSFVPRPKAPVTVTAPLWQITLDGQFNNVKLAQ